MCKLTFTKDQIENLTKNIYVKNVSPKGITYTMEFKHLAVEDYLTGLSSLEVFEKYGFDISVLGIKRPSSALSRWKKTYLSKGLLSLKDTRQHNTGRPLERELSDKEKLERYEVKIKYMEAEIEFLKKLEAKERLVVKNSRIKTYVYELINLVVTKHDYPQSTSKIPKSLNTDTEYMCLIYN